MVSTKISKSNSKSWKIPTKLFKQYTRKKYQHLSKNTKLNFKTFKNVTIISWMWKKSLQKKVLKSSKGNIDWRLEVSKSNSKKWGKNWPKRSVNRKLLLQTSLPPSTRLWSMTLGSITRSTWSKSWSNSIGSPKPMRKNWLRLKNAESTLKFKWKGKNYKCKWNSIHYPNLMTKMKWR